MRLSFVKMHGLGNDFLVLDAREEPLPPLAPQTVRRLADRREGVGCDQLIVLERAGDATCDLRMRIFNSDGTEVGACGNASRAIGLLVGRKARVETAGSTLTIDPQPGGASVDMGAPSFAWDAIPLAYPMDTLSMPVAWDGLAAPAAVNVGNPHVIFFVADCDAVALDELGPRIEVDPLFPERINVNVATIESRERVRLRVWERGAGLTRACGTGACATAVAAMRRNLVERKITVVLPGGPLEIAWGDDDRIVMAGAAAESFRGTFEWDDYA